MKTIMRFALVLMLVAALSSSAFAAETGTAEGDYNIPVTGSSQSGFNPDVISVDIVWGSMNFSYAASSIGTWDPNAHGYVGATAGGWSTNKAPITVTNHSNAAIGAAFSFTAASGTDVSGTFYTKAADDAYSPITSTVKKLMLASAEGTTVAKAPTGSIHFAITDGTISESVGVLGNITVTITNEH